MKLGNTLSFIFFLFYANGNAQNTLLPQWDGFQRDIHSLHNNASYFAQNGRANIPLCKSKSDPRVGIFSFDVFSKKIGLDSVKFRIFNESSATASLALYIKAHNLADSIVPTWTALNLTGSLGDKVSSLDITAFHANSWLDFSGELLTRKVNEARLSGHKIVLILAYSGATGPTMILQNSNSQNKPKLHYLVKINEVVKNITLTGFSQMQNKTSQKLQFRLDPSFATEGTDLLWQSSNTSIAKVAEGLVSADSLGKVSISVISGIDHVSATFLVDVVPKVRVQSIRITTKPFDYISIQEINQNFDKLEIDIQPANAGNKNVIWRSSNDSIATVGQDGTLIGLKEGNVTITATTVDGRLSVSRNLTVNKVWSLIKAESGSPSSGKRVFVTPAEYAGTDAYYTLYLPDSWSPNSNQRYPVFVDFPGRGVRPENIKIGQVLAQKFQGIWLCLPLIYANGSQEVDGWWANDKVTSRYVQSVVRNVCEQYKGNTDRIFAVGMSRGAVAVNYIGNYDEQVSDIWRGYYSHDHIDGQRRIDKGTFPDLWTDNFPKNGSLTHNGFFVKFSRINGRAYLISNSTVADVPEFLSGKPTKYSLGAFTGRDYLGINPVVPYHYVGELTLIEPDIRRAIAGVPYQEIHTSELLLSRLDDAQFVFNWFNDVMQGKFGVYSVSGKVTDENGRPVAGAIVEGGGVHFAVTDSSGYYKFEALPQGERTLYLSENNTFIFTRKERNLNLISDLKGIDFSLGPGKK